MPAVRQIRADLTLRNVAVVLLAGVQSLGGVALLVSAWTDPALDGTLAQRTFSGGGALLLLTAGGLIARRPWAVWLTTGMLYAAFFVVLTLMSVWWEPHGDRLGYWCLPALLPTIGAGVYALRRGPAAGAGPTSGRTR